MQTDLFPTTVGIEYAVVPANMSVPDSSKLHDKFGDWLQNEGKGSRVSLADDVDGLFKYECGAWEISSRPLKSMSEVKKFYDSVRAIYDNFGSAFNVKLVANTTYKNKKTGKRIYAEGGGGHLHLGQPKNSSDLENFNFLFYLEILNNPCLHWVMSEWCDDDILLSTFFHGIEEQWGMKVKNLHQNFIRGLLHQYAMTEWGRGPVQLRSVNAVSALKGNFLILPTHELRFFAAPIDYDHLVDNINLAMALWHKTNVMTEKNPHWNHLKYGSIEELKENYEYPRQTILSEFDCLLNNLNLDVNRYKRYKKNLDWRLKYGNLWTNRLPK